MTKPIALLDGDFVVKLYLNQQYDPVASAINRLSQAYDIRLTKQVLGEIRISPVRISVTVHLIAPIPLGR